MNTNTNPKWDDNLTQFARLLCEVVAIQDNLDIPGLAESMDLTQEDVLVLLDRANTVWETAKGNVPAGVEDDDWLAHSYTPVASQQGTEGQDRESYTDDQDRDEYTVPETHKHDWWTMGGGWRCDCGASKPRVIGPGI